MSQEQESPPTQLDYEIAAARLQQKSRDCPVGWKGKTWVQIFMSNEAKPKPGSKITKAALHLIKEILPKHGKNKDRIGSIEGCHGYVFTENDLTRLRKELSKKYPATKPTVPEKTPSQPTPFEGKLR